MIKSLARLFLLVVFFSYSHEVFASYEFLLPWSARAMGLGGAVTSSVNGAESLFFNPSGLARLNATEINLNLSPYIIQNSGPLNVVPGTIMSQSAVGPNGALFYGMKLNEKLGVGVGVYAAAGASNNYGALDLSSIGAQFKPEIAGMLADVEISLGGGYQLTPEFSLGAAWRISTMSGSIKTIALSDPNDPSTWSSLNIDGLSGTHFSGFRFGGQYRPVNGTWGVGLALRTAVPMNLTDGKTSGTLLLSNTALAGAAGATETTSLPLELTVGGDYQVLPNWKVLLQYDFTQYQSLKSLDTTGTLGGQSFAVGMPQNWNNQSKLRLGMEITDVVPVPIRLGYLFTSQVIPQDRATINFASPPGVASGFAIGSGADLSKNLHLDLAFNYVVGSGQGVGVPGGVADGKYDFKGYNFHTSLIYHL